MAIICFVIYDRIYSLCDVFFFLKHQNTRKDCMPLCVSSGPSESDRKVFEVVFVNETVQVLLQGGSLVRQ